jgi:hypothetical protein
MFGVRKLAMAGGSGNGDRTDMLVAPERHDRVGKAAKPVSSAGVRQPAVQYNLGGFPDFDRSEDDAAPDQKSGNWPFPEVEQNLPSRHTSRKA